MKKENKEVGSSGEQLARCFLEKKGFKIIDTNRSYRFGEIDILAEDKKIIVIVEVKTKRNDDFGIAQEMVHRIKQNKLVLLAKAIQQEYPDRQLRIDVVAINYLDGEPKIEYIENAVEGN